MELKYALQTFGIPSTDIPISEGKIRTLYHKQWLHVREAIEDGQTDIMECPLVNDVIFRQGKSLMGHAGNNILRGLIELKNAEQEAELATHSNHRMNRRNTVEELVSEIRESGGRFLIWNEQGWWSEMKDQKQIFCKIEYKVAEYRKFRKALKMATSRQRQDKFQSSSTHMFQSMQNDDSTGPLSWVANACGSSEEGKRQGLQASMMMSTRSNNSTSSHGSNKSSSSKSSSTNDIHNHDNKQHDQN